MCVCVVCDEAAVNMPHVFVGQQSVAIGVDKVDPPITVGFGFVFSSLNKAQGERRPVEHSDRHSSTHAACAEPSNSADKVRRNTRLSAMMLDNICGIILSMHDHLNTNNVHLQTGCQLPVG